MAGCPTSSQAFIIPAHKIFSDIEQRFGRPVTFPVEPFKLEPGMLVAGGVRDNWSENLPGLPSEGRVDSQKSVISSSSAEDSYASLGTWLKQKMSGSQLSMSDQTSTTSLLLSDIRQDCNQIYKFELKFGYSMNKTTEKPNICQYTVGWISALPREMARTALDAYHGYVRSKDPSNENSYHLGRIRDHHVVLTCLPASRGTALAAVVANQMIRSFPSIKIGLMVGTGGGVPSGKANIRLGDVVLGNPGKIFGGVVKYDFGKRIVGGKFQRTGSFNKPPPALRSALTSMEVEHMMCSPQLGRYLLETLQEQPEMQNITAHLLTKMTYILPITIMLVNINNNVSNVTTGCWFTGQLEVHQRNQEFTVVLSPLEIR